MLKFLGVQEYSLCIAWVFYICNVIGPSVILSVMPEPSLAEKKIGNEEVNVSRLSLVEITNGSAGRLS